METVRTRQMEDEIYKLRRALQYYADRRIYEGSNQTAVEGLPWIIDPKIGYMVDASLDRGEIARHALLTPDETDIKI
jgi:hypothetical protein